MYFITGDTHRDFCRVEAFCASVGTSKEDVLIILGDAGINYFGGGRDRHLKKRLSKLPITLFCIHGNHERRPYTVSSYREAEWSGGAVYRENAFPNLLFAKDGEIYDLDGKKCIAIGGAYSVDKELRLANGWGWWEDEQPSEEIKGYVEGRLSSRNNRVDYILSHTCPLRYEPQEAFIRGVDESKVDKSTGLWLDEIEGRLDYTKWYCGHYHIEKSIDKMRFLYKGVLILGD
ncbi:MAG: metallophosphoesterase [Clostridia bacterium]|nr:metallophosphoesterase [Clostridia bacterium]